jgi:hypothetical protein
MRLKRLSTLVLLASTFVWTYSELDTPIRATTGWCTAASPGHVVRRGYNTSFQLVTGDYSDNWMWHAGGRNTPQSCIEAEEGSLAWCDWACSNPGWDAGSVCAANPNVYRVDSAYGQLLWNPDGYEAFLQNGGTEIKSPIFVSSFCCEMFGLNCT